MKTQKSDHEEETIQTADDVVSSSLASGALSEVCDVAAVMRELDNTESDLVKQFVSRRCSSSCDLCSSQLNTISHSEPPSPR